MPELKIHTAGKISSIIVPVGTLLLDALRSGDFEVFSPCGGNGTCGKCKVIVKDEGYVTSCLFSVREDMEIVLPEPSEAKILAAQYEHSRILPISPGKAAGLSTHPFGVAIDLGTTTLAINFIQLITGSLIETRTVLNPQSKYGSDVISRINYCMLNPNGLKTLQSGIIDTINRQLTHFAEKFEIDPHDIVKISVCGNTTMLHLLLGVNPESLASVPFIPVFTEEKILKASEVMLKCNPEGEVKILPSLSAYIGADIVAGIASLAPAETFKNLLFIDVGTNGEMALITPEQIFCCSTAAGPAFEGANIEHGMGALSGAINIYNEDSSYQTIGDSKPLGICGSGLIDLVASLLKTGQVMSDGYMEESFVIVPAEESGTYKDIILTPEDIREIQLAKSAIAAGINILVQHADLTMEEVDALYLAGGFGNYIRTPGAVSIGLIPHELSGKVIPVGNTSATGSMLAVKSVFFDEVIQNVLDKMKYFELSDYEDFITEFAMNMAFPEQVNET